MINKLTERLFWETWPKVAKKAQKVRLGFIRVITDESCQCPIVAVARHLEIPGVYNDFRLAPVLRMSKNNQYPEWASDVIRASDNSPQVTREPRLVRTRLKLLKPMPMPDNST